MSQAPSVALAGTTQDNHVEGAASVALRGTARGLEILISGTPTTALLGARLTELLAEAPGFFAGSNARVAVDGMLPIGALACLEEIAARFELRLIEIGPAAARRLRGEIAAMPPIPPVPSGRAELSRTRLADSAESCAGEAASVSGGDAAAKAASVPNASGDAAAKAASVPNATGDAAAKAASVPGGAGNGGSNATSVSGAPGDAAAKAAPVSGRTGNADSSATSVSGAPGDAAAKADPVPGGTGNADSSATSVSGAPGDAAAKAASVSGRTGNGSSNAASVPGGTGNAISNAAPASGESGDAAVSAASAPSPIEPAAHAPSAHDPALVAALAAVLAAVGACDAAAAAGDQAAVDAPVGPRLVIGPVRSGRIVDHVGHLIVVGDVNPGAEVRAEGSIIVLGRLRGVAHAAIGRDKGCIIALSLQPQQLRIGRMVARAGDADRPSGGAEIAYVTGETIVVERFSGRLPSGLAASM
jgi:septum formation inhibitor MinC